MVSQNKNGINEKIAKLVKHYHLNKQLKHFVWTSEFGKLFVADVKEKHWLIKCFKKPVTWDQFQKATNTFVRNSLFYVQNSNDLEWCGYYSTIQEIQKLLNCLFDTSCFYLHPNSNRSHSQPLFVLIHDIIIILPPISNEGMN